MTVTEHKDALTSQLTEARSRLTQAVQQAENLKIMVSRLEGALAMCDALLQEGQGSPNDEAAPEPNGIDPDPPA